MQMRTAPASSRGKSRGQHLDYFHELTAGKITIWMRLPGKIEKRILGPFLVCDYGNNLLSEDIERFLWNDDPIKLAALVGSKQSRTLDKFVTTCRKYSSFRQSINRMSGPPGSLKHCRNRSCRSELAYQVY